MSNSDRLKEWWKTLTPDERSHQVEAAHNARRGNTDPIERIMQRAETRHKNLIGIGPHEAVLAGFLNMHRIPFQQQVPCGKYNIDFTIGGDLIAVEVCAGSGNNRLAMQKQERIEYILGSGRHLIEIRFHNGYDRRIRPTIIKQLISFIDFTRLNPPPPGKYRVIWPDGKRYPLRLYGGGRPAISAPDYLIDAAISKEW